MPTELEIREAARALTVALGHPNPDAEEPQGDGVVRPIWTHWEPTAREMLIAAARARINS
jgi:hypothetical protein